ncbi:ImmA/IrrE family metallo-endopeptidase [Senegalia massiliensis]|uniref:ImmA/IrrE family metallo-endopeptidase n=1 Tax=Senegalia massiliensis TaxID=1720316 RepID=A0A845QZP9_9CLOT|nr:ImmA/IrrE family metallo-endopeptidase [Senegalia massiliensis]NBI07219.1 ImmA/IrrE family metallo-endopeptidase [Senegalia massiliensis]
MGLRWINEYIYGLIEHCKSSDIYEIYNALNINIKKIPKHSLMIEDNEALYMRDYFNQETVFIKDNLDFQYEKFVLAHELGHAILHTEIYQAAYNKNLINKGKLEKQADYFALKLLNIEIDSIDYEGYTIEQISKSLHVSEKSLEMYSY